jgi:hypothetical protein
MKMLLDGFQRRISNLKKFYLRRQKGRARRKHASTQRVCLVGTAYCSPRESSSAIWPAGTREALPGANSFKKRTAMIAKI